MEEDLGLLPELVGVLGGEITDGGTFRTLLLHLRVTLQIGMKAVGDIFALGDDTYALWKVFQNLRHEQGIVGAAKDEGVDLGVEAHNLVDILLDEVVGTWGVGLVVLHEGYPERTGHT